MSAHIAIIDYGSGNLRSVEKAVEMACAGLSCADHSGPLEPVVSDDADVIANAQRIILPGVGAFSACMQGLAARPGVIEALEHRVLVEGCPFLGICVGMQLLARVGLEFGACDGLGWIDGEVAAMTPQDPALCVPNMGWREVQTDGGHPLFKPINGAWFYFAHSYAFAPENDAHAAATLDYGGRVVAAVARDNIVGVQFHPEKSQHAGLAFLRNFLTWTP